MAFYTIYKGRLATELQKIQARNKKAGLLPSIYTKSQLNQILIIPSAI